MPVFAVNAQSRAGLTIPRKQAQSAPVARHARFQKARTALPKPVARTSLSCKAVISTEPTAQKVSAPTNIEVYTTIDNQSKTTRPRVVILGSGWGAVSLIKSLPANISEKYEVILVSPRNYFLYTPLLPAVAAGTVEERSIVEPVRNLILGKGDYYEAVCKQVFADKKELVACFPADTGLDEACFKVSYDVLIVSVGSVNNTFGIQGVDEHCFYFKSIDDANKLRRRVSECFERAALPQTPEEERKRLLSFVVVGGGPTGVEVAAELYDMIHDDLDRLYPNLVKEAKIRVIELMDHVLSTYDRAISSYTTDQFRRAGVDLVLNSRVAAVKDKTVEVIGKDGEKTEIQFGACVWATGIAMNPLLKDLQQQLPGQTHFRSVLTDDFLRVKGSDGSIFALGDACTVDQPKALEYADELFDLADVNKDGTLTLAELRNMMNTAAKRFSHLEEHARFLESKVGVKRFGALVKQTISPMGDLDESSIISKDQFHDILKTPLLPPAPPHPPQAIDSGLRALPATAQVARQQGEFLADLLSTSKITGVPETTELAPKASAFKYRHKGSLAYIGRDKAVMDVPSVGPITGYGAGLLWKGFETYSQISFRNQCLVAMDWARTKLFGRDISRV